MRIFAEAAAKLGMRLMVLNVSVPPPSVNTRGVHL
jgi:hypothetical protein